MIGSAAAGKPRRALRNQRPARQTSALAKPRTTKAPLSRTASRANPVRQRNASGRRIDAQAGTALAGAIRQADEAIRQVEPAKDLLDAWRNGLAAVLDGTRSTALVAGCAAHLLYEAGHLCADAAARTERPTKPHMAHMAHMAHMVLITDLHEGGNARELLQRLAALVRSGADIELVRPNDEAPNTDHRVRSAWRVGQSAAQPVDTFARVLLLEPAAVQASADQSRMAVPARRDGATQSAPRVPTTFRQPFQPSTFSPARPCARPARGSRWR